jgi:hypothetical protein
MPQPHPAKPTGPTRAFEPCEHAASDPVVLPPPGYAAAGLDDADDEPERPGWLPADYEAI